MTKKSLFIIVSAILLFIVTIGIIYFSSIRKEATRNDVNAEHEKIEYATETESETPEDESVNAEELIAMDNSTDDNIDEPVEEPEQTGEQEAPAPDYIVEACNKTMYAVSSVNLRQGPSAETTKIGSLSYAQQVTVTGIVTEYKGQSCLWYQLSTGEFVSGNYLSANKPQQTTNEDKDTNNKENNDSGNSQEEKKDNPFEWDQDDELPSDGDFYGGGGASGNDSDFRF